MRIFANFYSPASGCGAFFCKISMPLSLYLCLLCVFSPVALAEDDLAMGPPEPVSVSIYDRPYSLWESDTNMRQIGRNSIVMAGACVGAMGILYLMPTSVTNWEDGDKVPFNKWWDHVSHAPVWDEDDWFLNYVTHPYAGAVYYMGARSAGANAGYSFVYSFVLSTFFWEYGIEAFAERPSIQDLIVTPVAGAVVGEGFYLVKRHIVDNDYHLFDSKVLGVTTAFLVDPITEVSDLIWGDSKKPQNVALQAYPTISDHGKIGGYLTWHITF